MATSYRKLTRYESRTLATHVNFDFKDRAERLLLQTLELSLA